jgi:hypothetical protein
MKRSLAISALLPSLHDGRKTQGNWLPFELKLNDHQRIVPRPPASLQARRLRAHQGTHQGSHDLCPFVV